MPWRRSDSPRAALLERMLDAVSSGVVYVSAEGTIEVVNSEALEIFGVERSETVGKDLAALRLTMFDETGRKLSYEEVPSRRVIATGAPFGPTTIGFVRANGQRGWAEFRASPFAVDDAPETKPGVLVTFVDMTDRIRMEHDLRVSEAAWRTIAANIPDSVLIADVEGRITFVNRLAPGITYAEVLGKVCWDFVAEERRAGWRAQFEEAIATGKTLRFETMGRSSTRPSGLGWYETVLVPLREEDETPRVVILARDVTEQRLMLARLAEHDRLASLGMVAASVAHEIMNPLTYVLVNLEYAIGDRQKDPERTARALADAREGALRMQQIVRDLRSLGRSGGEELFYVDMRGVVETAMRIAGPEIAHASDVTVELDDMPAVLANESRLCQVFINLLVNAAQAVRDQPVRKIHVRSVVDEEAGFVGVAVSDSGPGIPLEQQAFVFEPFYTTKPQGTGLGLSITREILKRMGGRVDMESTPGSGVTFTVWLPMRRTPGA